MLRQVLCCFLVLMLIGSGGPAIAKDMTVQQVKDRVREMEGKGSTCKLKMRDGTLLQGKISQSSSESFTIADKDRPGMVVAYGDVTEFQKKGMHLVAKLAIIVGIAFGVILGVTLAMCEGKFGCSPS